MAEHQPTKQEILDALKKKGVNDLDEFVDRIINQTKKGAKADIRMYSGYINIGGIF